MARQTRTSRRSSRFAPMIGSLNGDKNYATEDAIWDGEPLKTRPTERDDLYHDEVELWMQDDRMQTVFYHSFTKSRNRMISSKNRNGRERFAVGDTVLVQTMAARPSIGVIMFMWENHLVDGDQNEEHEPTKMIKIHWFLRPSELAAVRAKRVHEDNEIYYSLSSVETITPSKIIAHCSVSNKLVNSRNIHLDGAAAFFCQSSVNAEKGLFFQIDWQVLRADAIKEDDDDYTGAAWNVHVQKENGKSRVKKVKASTPSSSSDLDEEFGSENESDDDDEPASESTHDSSSSEVENTPNEEFPQTPSRKRKRSSAQFTTPSRKRAKIGAKPTPHSKAALRTRHRRKITAIKPLSLSPLDDLVLQNLPDDPFRRAMHVLHVGERPDTLPCRDDEYVEVMSAVVELLEEGSGGCIYISGVPGTGKTATVYSVVRDLKQMAEKNTVNPFTYVDINGLRIQEPNLAYALLWEVLSGHDVSKEGHLKISPKEALKKLTRYFSGVEKAGPANHACIVLMDELDQLVTPKQDIIYNFFNWPNLPASKLIVIAVANTHDLPERTMSAKVRSRLGMTSIKFMPYQTASLQTIVQSRLDRAKQGLTSQEDVLTADAVKFACAKVGAVSGDARRVLDICRRAVEIAAARDELRAVTIDDMTVLIKDMQASPTASYIRECSFHEKVMLAVMILLSRKQGIVEVRWGDVIARHRALALEISSKEAADSPKNQLNPTQYSMILDSLVGCRAIVIEEGAMALRKPEFERKLLLNIEPTEVQRVLAEGGDTWKNILQST